MKSLCTKSLSFIFILLLVAAAAACTQSKPEVPTPTLVPLANETIVLSPEGQQPTPIIGEATPAPGEPTLIPQPPLNETPLVPSDGQNPTPIIVEPTLLPTPTTIGDTGQPVQPTPEPGTDTTGQPSGACTNPYTVQPGEWFYAIARKCGVSPEALLAANPGLDPSILRPGQQLNMPAGGAAPSEPPPSTEGGQQPPPTSGECTNPYVVQSGDTLNSIARKCGTTVEALQAANNIPSPDYIFAGQQLTIP
jgi:LysM repeat protein